MCHNCVYRKLYLFFRFHLELQIYNLIFKHHHLIHFLNQLDLSQSINATCNQYIFGWIPNLQKLFDFLIRLSYINSAYLFLFFSILFFYLYLYFVAQVLYFLFLNYYFPTKLFCNLLNRFRGLQCCCRYINYNFLLLNLFSFLIILFCQ